MNQINFFQRREFGEIVGVAFQFVKQNFIHYFVNMLLLNLPIIILLVGGGLYVFKNSSIEQVISGLRFGGVSTFLGFLLVMFVLALLWVSYASAITYNYYLLYIEKGAKKFSLQDLFAAALASIFRLLVANLVFGLIIFIVAIIFGALVGALGNGGLAVLLGMILLILGIYYGIKIVFFQLIIVREKLNIFQAIMRSFNIIKGNWWKTFGLFFVFGVINYLISNIVNTALGLFGVKIFDATTFMGREIPQVEITTIVVFAIAQVITSVLSNMFSQTALFAQYGNLLEEKEGVGLKSKVDLIGKNQDNENDEEDF